jgi:hypothetical protein
MDKNKKIIIAMSVALVISLFFNLSQNRFYISVQNSDYSYKMDRWTGKIWMLDFDQEIILNEYTYDNHSDELSPKDNAIERVRNARTLSDRGTNEDVLRNEVSVLEGELFINGWKTEKINDQTFLVWYEIIHNGEVKPIHFEYIEPISLVRRVRDDEALSEKYEAYIN